MQQPTIGRIVHYRLTARQAEEINNGRVPDRLAGLCLEGYSVPQHPLGFQRHVGNSVAEGTVVPLIVTAVWPKEYEGSRLGHHPADTAYESAFGVNGQALLDGSDSLWVCSAPQHATLTGCWFWPPHI